MKYRFWITVMVLIMSVSLYSQSSLPKQTQFRNKNAVLISVPQMDTISVRLLRYKTVKATNYSFTLQLDRLTLILERTLLKNTSLTNDNKSLHLIIDKTEERFMVQEKIFETDLEVWIIKSKGKFKVFLYGTAIGALIILLLTAI